MRDRERVDSLNRFPGAEMSSIKGHNFMVRGKRFKGLKEMSGASFLQKNALPKIVVEADMIAALRGFHIGTWIHREWNTCSQKDLFSLV